MRAMVFHQVGYPLTLETLPKPKRQSNELLIQVLTCGVCRTDLHIIEGDLKKPNLPLILGHEVVGIVEEAPEKSLIQKGDRVGVFWLGSACGSCEFCKEGKENLCNQAQFTGYTRPGGYAEYMTCREDYAIPLLDRFSAEKTAPLLCAGLIGYRCYRKATPKKTIGFYGFGTAAHLLMATALYEQKEVYAFTRENDRKGQAFAKKMGAVWAGGTKEIPPQPLDAAILFASAGEVLPASLKALKKGGKCVCGEIFMGDIPSFPYQDLWNEKKIESVANVTREDAKLYFELLLKLDIHPKTTLYPLEKANEALNDLKQGNIEGAAVLEITSL